MQLDTIDIKNSQHWDGKAYHKIGLPQYEMDMSLLYLLNFRGDESVLDIGCGDGRVSHEIAKMIPRGRVTAIDASENMILAARQYYAQQNISFQHVAVESIKFQNCFDWVVSFFCFQWVADKPNLFKKVAHSLKPGGKLAMIAPISNPDLLSARNETVNDVKWFNYFENYHDPLQYVLDANYERYAEMAGFKQIQYSVELVPVLFHDYQHFHDFMLEMTPHKQQLPNRALQHEFMADLLRRYLQACQPKEDGQCELSFKIVKLVAQLV